jgi:hypothetical protein
MVNKITLISNIPLDENQENDTTIEDFLAKK